MPAHEIAVANIGHGSPEQIITLSQGDQVFWMFDGLRIERAAIDAEFGKANTASYGIKFSSVSKGKDHYYLRR
jgi:hypothetical protein